VTTIKCTVVVYCYGFALAPTRGAHDYPDFVVGNWRGVSHPYVLLRCLSLPPRLVTILLLAFTSTNDFGDEVPEYVNMTKNLKCLSHLSSSVSPDWINQVVHKIAWPIVPKSHIPVDTDEPKSERMPD